MISFFVALWVSIPFWIVYTLYGIGEKFFYFLPVVYQSPGYWNTVGLFTVILILKSMLIRNNESLSKILKDIRELLKKND